ncbi:VWA domain-containing protein [Actinoplanes sp. NPDC023936]|uniref:VWA domain-containing protein n=1 Tax=Actinoplanes sp. NPDC023936 TaxID=3154910 RepID=UPI003406B103
MTGPAAPGAGAPEFVRQLVVRLRRRGLPIGLDDCLTLRSALAAGFGIASARDFEALCVSLWAKSVSEQETIRAVLAGADIPRWDDAVPVEDSGTTVEQINIDKSEMSDPVSLPESPPPADKPPPRDIPTVHRMTGMSLMPPSTGQFDSGLTVAPQYPLTAREIAQTWRRLRRPVRYGAATEVDVDATIDRYSRTGVFSGPILIPPRRNTARLMLLVDRSGSMTPYGNFVQHLIREIHHAGRLESIATWYFRNLPSTRADTALLRELPDPFRPELDPILARIAPSSAGRLYADPELTEPRTFASVLAETAPGTVAVIVSDGGAARGTLQTARLVGTIAMIKALRCPVAWINPVPAARWPGTTAEQIARHVPMSELTAEGLHRAVDALRGRPRRTERPV